MMGDRFVRPVFVIGSPRSGTTLLQNLLCRDPEAYRLGRESRFLWHRLGGQEVTGTFPGRQRVEQSYLSELYRGERPWSLEETRRWALRMASQGMPAQYLDLPHELLDELSEDGVVGPFATSVQTETAPFTLPPLGATYASETAGDVRMVDKDTGHCWRLPQLAEAFPDARFVCIVRDPEPAMRSLIAGWRHPSWFFTYRLESELSISGYSDEFAWGRHWWNFNLFPGYQELTGVSLAQVCAEQWSAAVRPVIEHGLPLVDQGRAMFVRFESLVEDPRSTLARVAGFAGLDVDAVVGNGLDKAYMSMASSTWDPGESERELAALAAHARSELTPAEALLR